MNSLDISGQTITTIKIRNTSIIPQQFPGAPLEFLSSAHCPHYGLHFLEFYITGLHGMHSLMCSFFSQASFTQHNCWGSPTLFCISIVYWLLSSMSFCGYTTICLPIRLLMDICVISSFLLFLVKLLWTSLCKTLYGYVFR